MALKSYRELEVWRRSMDLVVDVYRLTRAFPGDERYGLTSQVRRAAVSVPANIAEGYERTHRGDYLRHLSIARGSLAEVETHLAIATRLEFVERQQTLETWNSAQEVGRMLRKLIQSLDPKSATPAPSPQTPDPGSAPPSALST